MHLLSCTHIDSVLLERYNVNICILFLNFVSKRYRATYRNARYFLYKALHTQLNIFFFDYIGRIKLPDCETIQTNFQYDLAAMVLWCLFLSFRDDRRRRILLIGTVGVIIKRKFALQAAGCAVHII